MYVNLYIVYTYVNFRNQYLCILYIPGNRNTVLADAQIRNIIALKVMLKIIIYFFFQQFFLPASTDKLFTITTRRKKAE